MRHLVFFPFLLLFFVPVLSNSVDNQCDRWMPFNARQICFVEEELHRLGDEEPEQFLQAQCGTTVIEGEGEDLQGDKTTKNNAFQPTHWRLKPPIILRKHAHNKDCTGKLRGLCRGRSPFATIWSPALGPYLIRHWTGGSSITVE